MVFSDKYWLAFFVAFVLAIFVKPILCVVLIGIAFIFLVGSSLYIQIRIAANGKTCVGAIVDYKPAEDGGHTPIVTFTTDNGRKISGKPVVSTRVRPDFFRTRKESTPPTVMVKYMPANPERFLLPDYSEAQPNKLLYGFFLLIGLMLIVTGIYVMLKY